MVRRIIPAIFAAVVSSSAVFGRTVTPGEFRLFGYSSVSDDGKTLMLDSSVAPGEFGWKRYAYAGRDWFLESETRYNLSFKVRLEAAGKDAKALVLIRPVKEGGNHFDCGSLAVIPTGGRWKTVKLKFATGKRKDYALQLHSWNRIKAEFTDIRLEKAKPLKFEPVTGISPRVDVDTSSEPRGAKEFSVDMPHAGNGLVLNAADFGASEANADNTAAFRAALAEAKRRQASRLEVPRGTYRFLSDSPLSMDGYSDFVFDGGGSVFVSHRRSGAFFRITNCTRVRFLDFSLDWDWSRTPLASLVKVKSLSGGKVDLEFTHYDAFPDTNVFFTCASPFDPSTGSVGMEGRRTFNFDSYTGGKRTVKAQWVDARTVRLPMRNGMKPGELYRLQHYYYHMGGVVMGSNAHLNMERVRIISTPGHAFVIAGTQHHTHMRKVDITAPADDPRRVITCTADHLHLSNSGGYIKLEDCEFSLGGDDIFNMHDNSAYAEKTGPKSLKVLNSSYYTKLPAGTEIELRNMDYSPAGSICKVAKAVRTGARTADIVFEETLPGETGDGFILFDRRYDTHNMIVRDCTFRDNRARGLLIAARDVTLERNVFRHQEAGAIKIETGYTLSHWSEGYGVSNVVVRNNVFDSVNPTGRPVSHRQRSVYTGIYLKTDPSTDTTSYPIIRDVLFEGNEFRESTGVAAYLTSIKNVTFRDNVFIDRVPRISELPYRSQFYLENARDVKIVNNRWVRSPCVKAPGVEWDPDTCENVTISGNSVVEGGPLSLSLDKGNVDVLLNGRKAVSCTGLVLAFGKKHFFGKGTAVAVPGGFEVTYAPPSGYPADKPVPRVKGVFTSDGGSVSLRYTVENATKDGRFRPDLCMFGRRLEKGLSCTGDTVTHSYWVRDPDGGQPWEMALGRVISCTNATGCGVKWVFEDGCNPNPRWRDPWHQHLRFRATGSNSWESVFRLFPTDGTRSDLAIALAAADRPAHVTIRTGKTYNWFDDPSRPLSFTCEIMNAQNARRRFDVSWQVRGFNGPETLESGMRMIELAAGESASFPVSFDVPERRGLYFVELIARDAASGREAFTRTNLARLPPHRFTATPETSPFGIAAYWPVPDEESVQRLMDRMGVMWVRSGDTRLQHPPRVANHSAGTTFLRKLKGAEREKWIIEQFELCRKRGNPHWEFCNEVNMATAGIALKSEGIGRALLAPLYADFVRDIHRIQREKGYTDIKLLSVGLAGFDDVFTRRLHELGVWNCFSGFCLHPGRGNFTPDYPYLRPERNAGGAAATDGTAKAEQLSRSNFWNFLGAVRGAQKLIREQGDMPLWLTEIYTPTFPNSSWEDSLRCSAENTVLTYALIKADGVKCGMYYQLFDTVWYDRLGVNHKDREYYFGLLNRDLSFKPAMMAYCAIAEALDGATFVGWLKTGRDTVHALAFRTPRGTMVIAWDRTEGYILNRDYKHAKGKRKRYRSPEPWEPYWKNTVDFTLPAAGPVTTVNPIGQETSLATENGNVTVKLTGAPLIIHGIDPARLSF